MGSLSVNVNCLRSSDSISLHAVASLRCHTVKGTFAPAYGKYSLAADHAERKLCFCAFARKISLRSAIVLIECISRIASLNGINLENEMLVILAIGKLLFSLCRNYRSASDIERTASVFGNIDIHFSAAG